MMRSTCLILVALTISLTTWAGSHAAQAEDLSSGGERLLGGHSFMHSRHVLDPFVSTEFTNHVGAASALSFERDFHDRDGNLLFTLEGNMLFASLGMGYQQHLGEKWAVGLGASGLVRSGTNALAFINDGANANTNIDLWVKRRLRRSKKSQLTAGISWGYASTTIFTPREFAAHLIDGGSLATAPFVRTGKSWEAQADLMWAYAFNPTFGLRAHGAAGVVEQDGDGGVLLGNNQIGVLGEVDFKPRYDFPLGLTLGHFVGFPRDHIESGLSGTELGFWYTGRQEFIIGLETGWLRIPSNDDGDAINGAFGVINIKYYF